MNRVFFILLLAFLFSANSVAETESWYFNASIGLSNTQYPDSGEQVIITAENNNGVTRVSPALDVGFYWPFFNDSILLGAVLNASIDSVQTGGGNEVVAHDLDYTGISAIKFFSDSIGKGFFVRGDYGSATSTYRFSNNLYEVDNGSGSAVLIGAGYGKPLSGDKARLIFSFNTITSTINDRDFSSNQLTIGLMW